MLIYFIAYAAIVIVFALLVGVISFHAMDVQPDIEALISGAEIMCDDARQRVTAHVNRSAGRALSKSQPTQAVLSLETFS